MRYISKGLTDEALEQGAIKITLISPGVSAAKKAIKLMATDILTELNAHAQPIEYNTFSHGHDPWVFGR
ncbi:MAG: hypothetical protein ACTSQH_07405 [Candidatus Hodarchaeales archaeon]